MTLDERTELSIDDCRYISEMPKGQFNVACKNLNLWNEAGINEENATEALFKLDDLLKQENLKYWLVYGTALGFCRDGNFIPWDDDIDIHVEANEFEPKFQDFKNKLIENGFVVRAVARDLSSKMSIFYKGIKLQIQGIYQTEQKPNMIQTKLFIYPKEYYYDGAHNFNYKGRDFRLPGPPDKYLSFCYNENWKTPQNIPDWRDYMNVDQLKDPSWRASHINHNKNKKK